MSWKRDPSIQFLLMLVAAPVLAVAGSAMGVDGGTGTVAGWLATCAVWSVLGWRCYRHERRRHPARSVWSPHGGGAWQRFVVGVATFATLATGATLLLFGSLIGRWAR